jgi:cytochrome c oxidase subunit 4
MNMRDETMREHSEQHVVPLRVYFGIFAALLVLTFATYEVALIDLGPWNIVVALLIAAIKSTLVALFFMHAYYSPSRTRLVLVCGIAWLGIMIFLTLGDYMTRAWH